MLKLRTEEEIIATWKDDIDKPVVSICCLTYNHEKFIEDAIRGFLIQETDFPFEIIIHDDASTDGTQDIILKYSNAYPKIVKTILQAENKYSIGINPGVEFLLPAATGKYIALCEGDDYWISNDKLSKQIQYMRKQINIGICFHPAFSISNCEALSEVLCNYGDGVKIININDVIRGGGGFMPTASIVFDASKLTNIPDELWRIAPVGDFYIQMICSENGALYIPEVLSVYRINHGENWSSRQNLKVSISASVDGHYKALAIVNEMLNGRHFDCIKQAFGRYMKKLSKSDCFSLKEKSVSLIKYRKLIKPSLLLMLSIYLPLHSIKKVLSTNR